MPPLNASMAGTGMLTQEREPLIHRANTQIKDFDANRHLGGEQKKSDVPVQAMLFMMPVVVFTSMMMVMFYLFYSQKALVMLILCVVLFCCVILATIASPTRRWLRYLGLLCFLAALAGFGAGWYNHYKNMIYYYTYNSLRKYTNVAGSEQSTEFGDAGMVSFTGDTSIDSTRASGFKNAADNGNMYCIAPITDSNQGEKPITFWAVGVNCCAPRASFTCDDAGDGGAKSALILLDKEFLVPEDMEWAIEGMGESRSAFIEPMRFNQALFGTVAAKQTSLVRWAKDPHKFKDEYRHNGIHTILIGVGAYVVISLFVALGVAYAIKPKRIGKAGTR